MRPCTKFVRALAEGEREARTRLHREGRTHRQRQRAHAVLLSAQGFTLAQLAVVCAADRDTVSGWLDAWRREGLSGVADAKKPGRRRKIDAGLEAALLEILESPSPDLKAAVQAELQKRAGRSPGTP